MQNIIPLVSKQQGQIDLETLKQMRDAGLSFKTISEKLKIPKSTIAHRLKKEASTGNLVPLDESEANPAVQENSANPPVESMGVKQNEFQQTSLETLDEARFEARSSNLVGIGKLDTVQSSECTKKKRPTVSTEKSCSSSNIQRESNWTEALETSTEKKSAIDNWTAIGRHVLLAIPVCTFSPWLVATSANIYGKDIGEVWGWFVAIGIETFIIALAILAPRVEISFASPKLFLESGRKIFTATFWYAVLSAVIFLSFQTLDVQIKETSNLAVAQLTSEVEQNSDLQLLRKEKEALLNSMTQLESKGWIGEARKLRENLKLVNTNLENIHDRVNLATPVSIDAIEHRATTSRYMRIIVLLINVFCVHLLVHFRQTRVSSKTIQ